MHLCMWIYISTLWQRTHFFHSAFDSFGLFEFPVFVLRSGSFDESIYQWLARNTAHWTGWSSIHTEQFPIFVWIFFDPHIHIRVYWNVLKQRECERKSVRECCDKNSCKINELKIRFCLELCCGNFFFLTKREKIIKKYDDVDMSTFLFDFVPWSCS